MPETKCYPHVTAAAVIERENKFLIVEETNLGVQVFNQPAGHVERDETLELAIQREVLEATGFIFKPTALVRFYHLKAANGVTYPRFNFKGELGGLVHGGQLI